MNLHPYASFSLLLAPGLTGASAAATDVYTFPVTGDGDVESWRAASFERVQDMGDGCGPLEWTLDPERRKVRFRLTSAAPDDGWVAAGISENGGMKGADLWAIRELTGAGIFDDSASFESTDLFSTDFALPEEDVLQNVELIAAWRDEDGRLVGVIERDLETCDKDDIAVEAHKQHVVCASGRLDGVGNVSYHGPNRHSETINLMLDEELLMERKFLVNVDLSKGVEVEPGFVFYDDPATAAVPFAIDVNLIDVSLDQETVTSYYCRVFTNPDPMQVVAYEAVWNDGTTLASETAPDYLHHEMLMHCPSDPVNMQRMDGKPFDCFDDMLACDIVFNHAKSGLVQAPPGTSIKMDSGVFVLQVHYDNTYHVPILNDNSGLRLWVLPDEQARLSESGNIVTHVGAIDTIRIPADPLQRDYTLQFQISSEATRATLPKTGIQVFGAALHMHKAGLRGRLQLIRDGENVLDVYDSRSYDFDRQAPDLRRWRLLPGDAMIFACIFRPDKYVDILGGLRTEDEMCNWAIGFSPELPNYRSGVGYLVTPDQPFRNSFIGNVPNTTRGLYMPEDMAPFSPDPRGWVDLREYREDHCETVIRDESNLSSYSWGDANVYAIYVTIAAFVMCLLIERLVPGIRDINSLRIKRNAVVCIIQLIFSTAFLVPLLVLAAPIFDSNTTFKAYDVDTHNELRGIISTQILLYIIELFYRVGIRPEVVAHHILTAGLFIFLNYVASTSFAFEYATKLGAILILLAMLDQPKNLTLLIRYLGHGRATWWPMLCQIAAVWYVFSKLAVIAAAAFFMAESHNGVEMSWSIPGHSFSEWMENYDLTDSVVIGVVSMFMFLLLLDQLYTAHVLWKLATRAKAQNEVAPSSQKPLTASTNHIDDDEMFEDSDDSQEEADDDDGGKVVETVDQASLLA